MPRRYPAPRSRTDHQLYDPISDCTYCPMVNFCSGPVPPVGPVPAHVMLIGEAPASSEEEADPRAPIVGATWLELEPLLELAGLNRDVVWISNSVFCRPPNDPTYDDARECWEAWKPIEIACVQPRIVVLMGQIAIASLFEDAGVVVSEVRGFPVWWEPWSCWVLPTYHPAAVLHNDRYRAALNEDFRYLAALKIEALKGRAARVRERPVDAYTGKAQYRWGLPVVGGSR